MYYVDDYEVWENKLKVEDRARGVLQAPPEIQIDDSQVPEVDVVEVESETELESEDEPVEPRVEDTSLFVILSSDFFKPGH